MKKTWIILGILFLSLLYIQIGNTEVCKEEDHNERTSYNIISFLGNSKDLYTQALPCIDPVKYTCCGKDSSTTKRCCDHGEGLQKGDPKGGCGKCSDKSVNCGLGKPDCGGKLTDCDSGAAKACCSNGGCLCCEDCNFPYAQCVPGGFESDVDINESPITSCSTMGRRCCGNNCGAIIPIINLKVSGCAI